MGRTDRPPTRVSSVQGVKWGAVQGFEARRGFDLTRSDRSTLAAV